MLALSLGVMLAGCASRPPASAPAVQGGARPVARRVAEPARPSQPPEVHPSRSRAIPPPPGRRFDEPPWRPWTSTIVVGVAGEDSVDGPAVRLRAPEPSFGRKSDYWSPCVRDFVQTQPEAARGALGDALTLYSTSCAGAPDRRVELRTPPAGRMTPPASHLGLVAALSPATCELALTAAYHGAPVDAERITLIADGARWSSPRILFDHGDGWEIATLTVTRSLARVVQQAAAARDAVLRFEGARDYQDVVITDAMKQDLRVVLDALDAISCP